MKLPTKATHAELIRYMLQFHPDIDTRDKEGSRPLENAARRGKEDSALLLLDADRQKGPHYLDKTMDLAIRKDESLLVKNLLRQGVAPNDALPSGLSPLGAAASSGGLKTVKVLLDSGADPNRVAANGTTPLEDASLKGFTEITGALLDHGARVNQVNSGSGTTALYAAASFGKESVAKTLLERGANPNVCGRNTKTPYRAAVENGYSVVANEIKARGGGDTCDGHRYLNIDSAQDREQMTNLGANGYFRKPSAYDEFMKLGDMVKALFGKRLRWFSTPGSE